LAGKDLLAAQTEEGPMRLGHEHVPVQGRRNRPRLLPVGQIKQ